MKFLLVISLVIYSLMPMFAFSEPQQALRKDDFTTWTRANVKDFGCFLEKEFGHKEKKFNCDLKKYVNKGDPCKNIAEYYEGPEFPKEMASKIDSRFESIILAWEHGELQSVSVTLKGKYSEKELMKSLRLPAEASIQDCNKTSTCLVIIGFDHLGGGEVDCSQK